MEVLKGFISDYCEMGSEGITGWVFYEERTPQSNGNLHSVDAGDHLKVYGQEGEVLFDGVIEYDFNEMSGMVKDSLLPFSLGYMVEWIQKGWDADEWGKLFFHARLLEGSNGKDLRAELVKKEK